MTEIPNGWIKVPLDDICQTIRGITFPTTEKRFQPDTGLIACLRTANVQATVEWDDLWFVPQQYVKNDEQLVSLDDILISTANSYELVGKVSRVTHLKFSSTLGAFISLLRANRDVDAGFLYYQMASESVQRSIREMSSTTTNISNVSGAKLKTLELHLAPTTEQIRIVTKLEELLSDLDAGVAELKVAQKKLGQYRQSLLKAAVEGALTADWRSKHKPLETGAQLLERILTERRARWEAKQGAKFAEQGKPPPKDWQKKYPEAVQPETTDLPELPDGWVWASVDQIADVFLGKMLDKTKHTSGRKLPYLRNVNVRWGAINVDDVYEMFFDESELERFGLKAGDVLVCEGGEPGRAAICKKAHEDFKYQKALHRVRLFNFYEPELLVAFLEFAAKAGQLAKTFTGSTINHFTKESFLILPIPLPPLAEQRTIVESITAAVISIHDQEFAIEFSLKQSTAQRQNILRAAFAGQLVPQNTNDEPASVLLERIRAERIERDAMKTPRGRKVKAAT